MSVQTQIDRLNAIKQRIRTNLVAQGITVPEDTMLEAMAEQILSVAGEDGKDYVLTEADKSEIAALVIKMLGGNPVFGYVDSDTMTIVLQNAPDGQYSLAYIKDDGTISAPIGSMEKDTRVYYTVTNTLTQCTNSNSATKAVQGGSYSATITANNGYELKSVTVAMGGSPVTVSGGVINIANVTGNIVITAVAEEKVVTPSYTNLAVNLAEGKRYSASNGSGMTLIDAPGICACEDFIPFEVGSTVRVKGFGDLTAQAAMFYSTKTSLYYSGKVNASTAHMNYEYDSATGVVTLTPKTAEIKYARFSGALTGTTADVIITVNEPIV
jgi:hypothetical protein